MENQTNMAGWMTTPIGTKEKARLEAKDCVVKAVGDKEVGKDTKKFTKIVLSLKHPDKEELINVSDIKYESKAKLTFGALFLNLDEEKKIQKGSALATLLGYYGAPTIADMVGKTVKTTLDENGYVVVKAY